jgi:ADP-heptose:LPS heptosyltransferase
VVAVFGPTDAGRTGPVGCGHRIVSSPLACVPCRRETCPLGHRRCLDELPVDGVAAALAEVVPRAPAARLA